MAAVMMISIVVLDGCTENSILLLFFRLCFFVLFSFIRTWVCGAFCW
jgi:hypothetical protein